MAKKTKEKTQLSLLKWYPTQERQIDEYKRVKGGKVETVSSHKKKVHVKPELSEKAKKQVKEGKAKTLITEDEVKEIIKEDIEEAKEDSIEEIQKRIQEEVLDPELFGISQKEIQRIIIEEKLVDSEVYKQWITKLSAIDDLQKRYEWSEDNSEKEKIQKEIEDERAEANRLYSIFRVLVEDEILAENEGWHDDFYGELSEADRFNFKTLEQLKKEEGAVETIENPFFEEFFKGKEDPKSATIMVKLSENGDKILLSWDNIGEGGNYKVRGANYETFLQVVRDKHGGRWVQGSQFVIDADDLESVIDEFKDRNDRYGREDLLYSIVGQNDTKKEWLEKANIQKEIVLHSDSNAFIFEVHGNNVVLKSGSKNPGDKRKDQELAMDVLNTAYKRTMSKRGKKDEVYAAVEINDKGEYVMPIGLLSKAYWLLKRSYNFDVAVADTRERSPVSNPELKGVDLYNYQKQAVLESLIEGQGLIVSPTGTGKTMMAAGVISGFIKGAEKYEEKTGKKVDVDSLFLVHRGTLRDQAKEAFDKFLPEDVNIGLLDSENFTPSWTDEADINVGTIQGMHSAIKKIEEGKTLSEKDKICLKILRESEIIIQDEAHHITARSFDSVYDENKTIHKFGLTATPSRDAQDDILRVMKIGDKRIPITYKQAQDRGMLMKPNVVVIPIPKRKDLESEIDYIMDRDGIKNKFTAKVRAQVEENEARNDLIIDHANRMHTAGKKTIIFTKSLNHANDLKELLEKEYPNTKPVLLAGKKRDASGKLKKMKKSDIETNKKMLESGKTNIAIGTGSLLSEGFDLPALDVILGAGASQEYSPISVMQTAGRAMRVSVGKEQPIIVEYKDDFGGFAERILKRRKAYNEYNAFNFTLQDEYPQFYGAQGDRECPTKKDRMAWVKQFIKRSEGTDAEKFQTSEFYQHKRARGLVKGSAPKAVQKESKATIRTLPHTEKLHELTRNQIYKVAQKEKIVGRHRMKKGELINALKYQQNWAWDNKDTDIALKIAGTDEKPKDIFNKAMQLSITERNLNPSQALQLLESEYKKKRVEF
ncbi:MAG: DEAD/DEAH box helicase family protein [Nanoarchaeota archaeon]|nr:DEAD/DEAH box helicase family protein [Nanoarchaeota archaeon]